MLGSDLLARLAPHFPNLLAPRRAELDLMDLRSLTRYLIAARPQIVINAVAYTDVDRAELEREMATLLNDRLPSTLGELAPAIGFKPVHFSTDYVFSGESERPWTEEDTCAPVSPNHYAHTKLSGEKGILQAPNALLLRVQWLYGEKRDRFTSLAGKTLFTPFSDQFGAPTWTKSIADAVVSLLAQDARGIFHYAADDSASWAEVYQFVKEELGLTVELRPQLSTEVKLAARRPRYGVMDNSKLKRALGISSLGSWKEPLREFLRLRSSQILLPTSHGRV